MSPSARSQRDGAYAPPNTLGEIVVRSDSLMTGYLNNPQATAAVLKDGWMHTGDAGTIDEDGFLYVADRVKDMIVTGGENVYSIEVERALFLHPAVREAAVIGVPSDQWGESVHAVIVLNEGAVRDAGGIDRALPAVDRRLQGAAQLRVPRRAVAGHLGRQGAQERAARSPLGRARSKDLSAGRAPRFARRRFSSRLRYRLIFANVSNRKYVIYLCATGRAPPGSRH